MWVVLEQHLDPPLNHLIQTLSMIKLIILAFIVVSGVLPLQHPMSDKLTMLLGWVVLGGHTKIENPHANFHNAFAGSSHSSNDVCTILHVCHLASAYSGTRSDSPVLRLPTPRFASIVTP